MPINTIPGEWLSEFLHGCVNTDCPPCSVAKRLFIYDDRSSGSPLDSLYMDGWKQKDHREELMVCWENTNQNTIAGVKRWQPWCKLSNLKFNFPLVLNMSRSYSRLHFLQQVPSTCTGNESSEQFAGGQKILRHSTTPFWKKINFLISLSFFLSLTKKHASIRSRYSTVGVHIQCLPVALPKYPHWSCLMLLFCTTLHWS